MPSDADSYAYDFTPGPIPAEDPVLACEMCDGEGRVERQLPAGVTDLEPRYRSGPCEECDGAGYFSDAICAYCDDGLEATAYGVGARVTVRRDGRTFAYALCGPCAWREVVAPEPSHEYRRGSIAEGV